MTSLLDQPFWGFNIEPLTFSIANAQMDTLVTIHPDGTVKFGPKYTPDEASRIFWESIAHTGAQLSAQKIHDLEQEVAKLKAALMQMSGSTRQ